MSAIRGSVRLYLSMREIWVRLLRINICGYLIMAVTYDTLKENVLSNLPVREKESIWKTTRGHIANEDAEGMLEKARQEFFQAMLYQRVPQLDASENVRIAKARLNWVYEKFFTKGRQSGEQLAREDEGKIGEMLNHYLGEHRAK